MKLIGLAGRAGSGKDTLAGLILEHVTGQQRAFADPLRRAAQAVFGLTDEQMSDRELKERVIPFWGRSPRQILQLLGTESVRDVFGPDTWVRAAALHLDALAWCESRESLPIDVVIYTDCRFPEEAQWIRDNGGVVIEITRPDAVAVAAHSSEQPLPVELIDYAILNDGTIADLRDQVLHNIAAWLDAGRHYGSARRAA